VKNLGNLAAEGTLSERVLCYGRCSFAGEERVGCEIDSVVDDRKQKTR